MADIQLVETSLRDGNQCLWAALGIDTAKTLTIAPVMDRVGFKAIDFTTSTHMGVAVRYKQEDPWERIRLMAAATPNTPLQFMSTGFRFISWETASPEFMALAFRVLARNGIRRFCLADPMNDADSNVACARMVKQGGGEYVIAALVFTLSPIHDDAHYVERARKLAACPDVDALYIKDPGGLLTPQRARTLIPAIKAVIGDKPLELHAHCTIGLAELVYMDAPDYGVERGAVRFRRRGGRDLQPALRARRRQPARAGPHGADRRRGARGGGPLLHALAAAEGLPAGKPQAFDAALSAPPAAGRHGRHDAPAPRREPAVAPGRRGDRGARPRARGARLADRHDAVRADAADAGGHERDRHASATRSFPDEAIRYALGPLRQAQRADRAARDGAHRIAAAYARAARGAADGAARGAAPPHRRATVGRGISAAGDDARRARWMPCWPRARRRATTTRP